jgi:hypothetical protein
MIAELLACEEAGAGVNDEAEMTDEMLDVREEVMLTYEKKVGRLTAAQRKYLSSTTLRHYVDPPRPEKLVEALVHRHARMSVLRGENVPLVGSLRIVGWDQDGSGECSHAWMPVAFAVPLSMPAIPAPDPCPVVRISYATVGPRAHSHPVLGDEHAAQHVRAVSLTV